MHSDFDARALSRTSSGSAPLSRSSGGGNRHPQPMASGGVSHQTKLRNYEEVRAVEFGVFGPDEILRLAAAKVTVAATHTSSLPTPHGPNDLRLGTTDRRLRCSTCQRSCSECCGHLGAIQLAFPVYNVGFFDLVLKVLKSVCYYCSGIILTDSQLVLLRRVSSRDRKKRLAMAASLSKSRKPCSSCGGQNPVYTKQGLTIKADFSKINFGDPDEAAYCARPFTSAEARTILQSVSDEDCTTLGLNPVTSRPDNFVMTVLCVVPPVIRPSVVISEGSKSRGHDDLTAKLCDIVKCNNSVRGILEKEGASIPVVGLSIAAQTAVNDLTFHVGTFMNNDIRGQKPSFQRTGMPSKSIVSRLKGKDGRIRGTLMGKRTNFSARSVISPDPDMDVDEVGVPYRVAKILTVPVMVTDTNLEALRERVRHGAGSLAGADGVMRSGGGMVLLEFADLEREVTQLKVGDVVERYLQDNDVVLFNRQPSLHKGSMMAFRVKLMEGKTFRINLACTPSFNADCDGDELNVHVLQSARSQTEARLLMAAPLQVVSPQSNKPCMGLVQDSLLGAYLLSADDVRLTRRQMNELRSVLRYSEREVSSPAYLGDCAADHRWSGRQAIEFALPVDIQYTNTKTTPNVVITDGAFLQGRLCKLSLGTTYGSLVHYIWLEYSPDRCAKFMSDMQRLITRYLIWRGFSVRFSDCLTNKEVQSDVRNLIQYAEDKIRKVDSQDLVRILPNESEAACTRIANAVLTNIGKVVHASLDDRHNALYQTVNCGSKGNLINIAQIMGAVGQQSLEGGRIPAVVDGIRRIPLDASERSSLRPYGFVRSSFVKGLKPDEFFYYNISGREGLIDTSVKTATTGYMQRRLMKALETLKVEYDRTVRNSRDDIVQFTYGADDYDACFLLRINVGFISRPTTELVNALAPLERGAFRTLLTQARRMRGSGVGDFESVAFAPVRLDCARNIARGHGEKGAAVVRRDDAAAWIDACASRLSKCKVGHRTLQEIYLRWELRSEVMVAAGATKQGLRNLEATLTRQVDRAIVDAAEMVGALSSHAISNPLTQMVLNTFHFAGVSAKNVTLGVPRIKELIDVAKNIRTPTMKLIPTACMSDGVPLKFLRNSLVHFALGDAVKLTEIVREPDFHQTSGTLDERYVAESLRVFYPEPPETFSPYVARMYLRKEPLLERNMVPADVAEIIELHLNPSAVIAYAQAPMSDWFVTIRLLGMGVGSTHFSDKPLDEHVYLKSVISDLSDKVCRECYISGVPGICSINVGSAFLKEIDRDGEIVQRKVTVLETVGSNLAGVIGKPELRGELSVSNDVVDVLNTLGLEAAIRVLFDEIQLTIGFDGNFINPRHLSLLVALMSNQGFLMPINRHGLNRITNGCIAKCTFEETCDVLLDAAAFGETDRVLGVSECVAVGREARIGTGVCRVLSTQEPVGQDCAGADDQEEEEDDVVFTSVEADIECQNTRSECHPIEMPFSEVNSGSNVGSMSLLPSSIQHSFLQIAPTSSSSGRYIPSSPRLALQETRKRKYVPSSPRPRQQPHCGELS